MIPLHIETFGSGPELVLLHGWGLHSGLWQTVVEPLSRNYCVHLVDLPGHGRSPWQGDLSLSAVVAELDALFPRPVSVMGWSLGGLFALKWALQSPSKVEKWILVASSPCFRRRDDWPCAMESEVLDKFALNLKEDYRSTLSRFLALQAMGDEFARGLLRQMQSELFVRGEPDLAALEDGLNLLRDVDLRTSVLQLQQPGLLLYGGRDRLVPPEVAEWLHQHAPSSHLELFPTSAHAPHWSHPVEFCEAVKAFL